MLQSERRGAGVDGQSFEDIESYGQERWLDELVQELKSRTYQPLPVRRGYIPKPDGKQRPVGGPAIRDRKAEMGAVLRGLAMDLAFSAWKTVRWREGTRKATGLAFCRGAPPSGSSR